MNTRKITQIIIIVIVAVLVIWDITAFITKANDDTISVVIVDWSRKNPLITFLSGMLCGHWFTPSRWYKELK